MAHDPANMNDSEFAKDCGGSGRGITGGGSIGAMRCALALGLLITLRLLPTTRRCMRPMRRQTDLPFAHGRRGRNPPLRLMSSIKWD